MNDIKTSEYKKGLSYEDMTDKTKDFYDTYCRDGKLIPIEQIVKTNSKIKAWSTEMSCEVYIRANTIKRGLWINFISVIDKTKYFKDNYCRDGLLVPMEKIFNRNNVIKGWSVELGYVVNVRIHHIMNGRWVSHQSIIDQNKYITDKFRKIHGDKYNYSKVDYKAIEKNVTITCHIHGDFQQTPHSHLRGSNCGPCSGINPPNTERFIKQAILVHGNKYDYSKVDFISNRTKVIITCIEHGDFKQLAYFHLDGQGCLDCSGTRRLTTKGFIKQSKKVHGDKYDYSKVDYKNAGTHVTITCLEHGDFQQSPSSHLGGRGCRNYKDKMSIGEKTIFEYLTENKISFIGEKRFDDCRNNLPLPFDFYLKEYNLCIEFDGKQHFEPIKYFGGEKRLEYIQKNDKIKNDYCKENNINLLRIPYTEKDNINEILGEKLNERH